MSTEELNSSDSWSPPVSEHSSDREFINDETTSEDEINDRALQIANKLYKYLVDELCVDFMIDLPRNEKAYIYGELIAICEEYL